MLSLSNEELIKRCIDGDITAFEIIIGTHQKKIYNMVTKYFERDEAYDVTQEILLKIFKGIKHFKGESAFSTWIYKITINTCMDCLRKNKKDKATDMLDKEKIDILKCTDDESNPEIRLEKKELISAIRQSILLLPPDSKNVIILKDINGLTYDEISETLGLPLGTVKSRLHRARLELRGCLIKKEVKV